MPKNKGFSATTNLSSISDSSESSDTPANSIAITNPEFLKKFPPLAPEISRVTFSPNRLYVTWDYFPEEGDGIDPLVELFRPVRDRYADEKDLYVVILPTGKDITLPNGLTERTYIFTCCPKERKNVPGTDLRNEFDRIFPDLIEAYREVLEKWIVSTIGMKKFLEDKNKSSIRNFLISIDYPVPTEEVAEKKPKKTSAEKRADRKAYAEAHPEKYPKYNRGRYNNYAMLGSPRPSTGPVF
ncbi:hypothetical protein IKG02_00985 [Candidatus Saccharibacteria bacterium]|nr:hypothetical protein [Candidatus Saccharibacteria bacterium]